MWIFKLSNVVASADIILPRRRFAWIELPSQLHNARSAVRKQKECRRLLRFAPGEPSSLLISLEGISSLIACCTVTAGPFQKEYLTSLIFNC